MALGHWGRPEYDQYSGGKGKGRGRKERGGEGEREEGREGKKRGVCR